MDSAPLDLIILGAGPGGYVCALRAAQLGLRVALVEKRPTLGGTCLNVGCIPSKALLHSSELYHTVRTHGVRHGLVVPQLGLDLAALMKRKDEVVGRLVKGVAQLCRARHIEVLTGTGRLAGEGKVAVRSDDGAETVRTARAVVLATGSVPATLPELPLDGQAVITSDEAIALTEVPRRLAVVGAGAIGLELGSVWARLGSQVTVLEFLPQIAPGFDEDVAALAARLFKRQGLRIETKARVTGLERGPAGLVLQAQRDGQTLAVEADRVLVAVGRKPCTEGLGLDAAGVKLDARGRVAVDAHFRTSAAGVYAIGDLIAGPMLAHKAEEEGVALAEILAGRAGHVNYDVIPAVVYTFPELASAGLTERLAAERKIEVRVGKFPLAANGRALAADAADGLAKVVAEAGTDRLLGVQLVAPNASELIAEAVAHLEYGGSAEDLARTVHAHPTLSEALKEAALAVDGRALHSL